MNPRDWSYSGDPTTSTRDDVRSRIGDTDEKSPLLRDSEINGVLVQQGGNVAVSAALCALRVLAIFSRIASESSSKGDEKTAVNYSDRAKNYKEFVFDPLNTAAGGALTGSVVPTFVFVGGSSKADKADREQDDDRVQPQFYRTMFEAIDAPDSDDRTN